MGWCLQEVFSVQLAADTNPPACPESPEFKEWMEKRRENTRSASAEGREPSQAKITYRGNGSHGDA